MQSKYRAENRNTLKTISVPDWSGAGPGGPDVAQENSYHSTDIL